MKAQIVTFSRMDNSVYPTAVQDMSIEILTPFGAGVKASTQVRIIVYHSQFQERQAFVDEFRMIGMNTVNVYMHVCKKICLCMFLG
jgi:hypothetical protein